jgi:hypothetical protein
MICVILRPRPGADPTAPGSRYLAGRAGGGLPALLECTVDERSGQVVEGSRTEPVKQARSSPIFSGRG